jgi:D-lactate dehydrogenase (cytochrome)
VLTEASLAAIVGAGHVSADRADRELAGAELVRWADQVVPDLVVRPADTAQVAAIMSVAAAAGQAMVPRGAGLSYTGGVAARLPAIVLDLTRLDTIRIDAGNLFAVVGAGCTWAALAEALVPHGLCCAMTGPISGSHSTIGGAVAQAVPGSMDAVLGVTAVLADATVVRTGTWALPSSLPFSRQHGPDLTGLFTGDCGAFAVKTEVALRLAPIHPVGFESYAFDTGAAVLAAMTDILRAGVAARLVALDRMKAATAQPQGAGEVLQTIRDVARAADGLRQMVRDVAAMRSAPTDLADAPWSLHVTIASPTEAGVAAQAEAVRRIAGRHGRRIAPTVPKALHARPYSIRGAVGPNGERWAPVHGIFPLTRAAAAMAALEAHLAACKPALEAAEVSVNWLMSSSGAYVVIEPMFYWPDTLDPLHLRDLSDRNRKRFGGAAANPAGRSLVDRLRGELCGIMDAHGAAHGQIGRFYHLPDAVEPGSAALLRRLKAALDPLNLMNPGVLGL